MLFAFESIRRLQAVLSLLLCTVVVSSACRDSAGRERAMVGDVLWRAEPGIEGPFEWFGIPAAAGDRVFMDVGNSIKAFESSTGRELWSTAIRSDLAPETQNLVVQSGVVIASDMFAIIALDQESGAIRWKVAPNDSIIQSYGVADAQAYYTGTRGAFVYALQLSTGAKLWEVDLRTDWISGNVIGFDVSGDTLAVSGIFRRDRLNLRPEAFVVALDRRDGRVFWRFESTTKQSGVYSAPLITDRLVLLPDVLQKAMFALDRNTGQVRWTVPTDPAYGGPADVPDVRDGVAYFGAHDKYVYAVDLETGSVKWKTRINSSVDQVVICGNYVFASNQGANILDRATGRWVREVVAGDEDFLTSGWAVAGKRIFASGMVAVYALSCE